jgi:hypothetical protein
MDSTASVTTVPQRIEALGYEQSTRKGTTLAWRVGAAIRLAWEHEHRGLPPKGLARKSCGTGSHCFAVYPRAWAPRIDAEIERVAQEIAAELRAQLSLWPAASKPPGLK